jgi:hypothetical protein
MSVQQQTEKPIGDRARESVTILKKLTNDLGMSIDSPEVQELKQRVDAYIKNGTCWSGYIVFSSYGRIADVNLPQKATKPITVTLRVPAFKHK